MAQSQQYDLRNVQRFVPTELKNLCACVRCKLIMNESQWARLSGRCPNCRDDYEKTQDFVGMISVMMPQESWVAKWNEVRLCIPGVYAVNVPQGYDDKDDESMEDVHHRSRGRRQREEYADGDMKDFIADDDEEL